MNKITGEIHALKYLAGTALSLALSAIPEEDRGQVANRIREQIAQNIESAGQVGSDYYNGYCDMLGPTLQTLDNLENL